jgi:endo-1,4-beta-D-glucanase Y
MFGRQALSSAALAVIFGAALFAASCAQPGGGTTGAGGTGGPGSGGTTGNSCTAPQKSCSQGCTNVQTDTQNCGTCGTTCKSGQTCQSGTCTCGTGLLNCGGSCVSSSNANCGACGTTCTSTQVCSNNACSSSGCATGQTACSGGTCANLQTDNGNCGACGMVCSGGSTCTSGSCTCAVAGQQLCGSACTDTTSNTANCGSCGHACTTGQTCTNSACVTVSTTGTAGTTGSGSAGTTGSGSAGTTGSGTAGTKGAGGTTGSAGTTGTGGSVSRTCPAAGANVISDFEDGAGSEVVQGGRQGWWYVFACNASSTPTACTQGSQTPAANASGPVAVAPVTAPLPTGDTCDSYAMHSTGVNRETDNASDPDYIGFGTSFAQVIPPPASGATKKPYDVSSYDGISFNIKSGSGTAPPVWLELLNTETQPSPDGTATNNAVDEFNTRGKLLSNIGTTWTTVYVPFALLAPRYLPNITESQCGNTSVNCQAPGWNPKSALGFQFAVYPQFSTSTLNYDLWVDDVSFYTGTNGLSTFTPTGTPAPAHPFPVDGAVGSCTKPTGASGKYLVDMYTRWKSTFVVVSGSSARIQRPENLDDTVSEGIGYGMLIAVNMGDKTLFDQLWAYEQNNKEANKGNLMTWCVTPGGGGTGTACGQNGSKGGTATDADEDMAFALVEAGKQWGGSYAATAASLISDIWSYDMDSGASLPTGGSNLGSSSSLMNPSYFAPAYYRVFAGIDKASGHNWSTAATNVYNAINSIEAAVGTKGLIPAWCTGSCSSLGGGGYTDASNYQYDAHRVPWRIGLDACWNSGIPAAGTTFLTKNAAFFASQATNGIGRVYDNYTMTGGAGGAMPEPNSMSAIGAAGVGAMAAGNTAFANAAWHFLLDASYTPDPTTRATAYTYFNATVGLMTALTLSGNFSN